MPHKHHPEMPEVKNTMDFIELCRRSGAELVGEPTVDALTIGVTDSENNIIRTLTFEGVKGFIERENVRRANPTISDEGVES